MRGGYGGSLGGRLGSFNDDGEMEYIFALETKVRG
jgi:hypothetical protein